jgi:hypothetical protein
MDRAHINTYGLSGAGAIDCLCAQYRTGPTQSPNLRALRRTRSIAGFGCLRREATLRSGSAGVFGSGGGL